MLVPVKWLKDYVDIDIDTVEFADMMTMTGTKTETVEFFGEGIENVVVGKILEIAPHPNAEKLVVCQVNIGEEELVQICTGAKNVLEGDIVPVAKVNSTLPGGIKIKKGKLRGEASHGMLCGAEELGIEEHFVNERSKGGIYILNDMENIVIGQDIKEFLLINDAIIDFELTANRPDCRSMIGIAREAAVTIGKKTKYPQIEVKECDEEIDFDVKVENPELCMRYGARIIKDVKIGPSPYWMQRRLIEAGVRPINNIVDITKIDVGFTKPKFVNCDIVRVIEDITLSVVNYAENKNINIVFDTEIEEHIIKCDSSMIERAMLNLLSNAIKFTKENGNIVVNLYKDEQWVHIIVKDDGIGIPIGIQGMIFERFVQSNKSFSREREGSGIGLALVKDIISKHNGEVMLEDSSEMGSTFLFKIPNLVRDDVWHDDDNRAAETAIQEKINIEFSDIYDI